MPIQVSSAKNIEELSTSVSPKRQKIISLLSEKKWFRSTDFETKKKLFTLPEDFDGYLNDLPNRKDEYSGLAVNKLLDILPGNYSVISIFEVMSIQTAKTFTIEFASWKFGRDQGYRGVILFEVNGELKYFVLRKTEKFAIGETIFETVGTFVKPGTSATDIPEEVRKQVGKELGIQNVEIKKFFNLGKLAIDPVLANSTPTLYAAIFDAGDEASLEKLRKQIFHTKPINFSLVIEPLERLKDYIKKTDESYFLACVARMASEGIIEI